MQTKVIKWREPAGATLKAAAAGDFCPREVNSEDTALRAAEITGELKSWFDRFDLRILQWECAVTEKDTPIDKSGPNHRCFPPALAFAQSLGIDLALLANNHTGDYGESGVRDTLEAFRNRRIRTVGAGLNRQEAEKAVILEINGIRLAVLNAAEHEFGIAGENRPGAAGLDPIRLAGQIRDLKRDGYIVLTTLHGGHEHYMFPSPRLQQLCRFLAESGADAVFNCHTHCPCGYEIHNGAPIVYSPGNFYFPPRPTSLPVWSIGYVPKFCFDQNGAYAVELLPYYNRKSRLSLMPDNDAGQFFAWLDKLNEPLTQPSLLQEYFDAWCIISGLNGYLKVFQNPCPPWQFEERSQIRNWLGIRNLFSCESHHDLLRNTLSLIEFGKLKEAEKYVPLIQELQRPGWVATQK